MQSIEPQKAAQYKRVGILSAMGDRFAIGAITVLSNEYRAETLEFGTDDVLTAKIGQALAGRYETVNLSRYREAFLAAPKYWPGQQKLLGEDRAEVTEVVRKLMSGEALDAYILVTPGAAEVRGKRIGGIGIVKLQAPFVSARFLLHAAYVVSVIDGRDFAIVAHMRAAALDDDRYAAITAPNWPISPQCWEAPAANQDEIRTVFDQLISRSVPETLRRAELIGK
ncbi:MAG TPA: hypothetical protein VHT04_08925 [Stellaceae bacterium]|nr:hypothetical protein [Stellaceae bacterium]